MLSLLHFLLELNDYTILRIDKKFPNFKIGEDDIDILCLNIEDTCNCIINVLKKKYPQFKYRMFSIDNKVHIDVHTGNKFIIKFDLCDNIKKLYPLFNIPNKLTEEVIKTSIINNYGCKIPTIENELMLRKLEYDTYIESRPDKIKHLKFIEQHSNIKYREFTKKM